MVGITGLADPVHMESLLFHLASVMNGSQELVESGALVESPRDVVVVGRVYVDNLYRFFA